MARHHRLRTLDFAKLPDRPEPTARRRYSVRAAAEACGDILWLRPEYQNPSAERTSEQSSLGTDSDTPESTPVAAAPTKPTPWPKDTFEQVRAVADLLTASPVPLSLDEIAARFTARGPWKKRLPKLVEMLVALGRAQEKDESPRLL